MKKNYIYQKDLNTTINEFIRQEYDAVIKKDLPEFVLEWFKNNISNELHEHEFIYLDIMLGDVQDKLKRLYDDVDDIMGYRYNNSKVLFVLEYYFTKIDRLQIIALELSSIYQKVDESLAKVIQEY